MSIRDTKSDNHDHLKVFATPEAPDEWFKQNDPEERRFRIRSDGVTEIGALKGPDGIPGQHMFFELITLLH
jgi:hypothetical protein